MKKLTGLIISIALTLSFTACEEISQIPLRYESQADEQIETEEVISYTEYIAEIPEIETAEASMIVEAEDCSLNGNLTVASDRKGYSGDGYVTGFLGEASDYLIVPVEIPVSQHYDITVCVAADEPTMNTLTVNGNNIGEFNIEGEDENFVRITYYGVYIDKGEASIQVNHGDKQFDIDYIELNNNEEIYQDKLEVEAKPVSEKSSYETKDILRYFKENLGENIITGQFVSDNKNLEMEYIYEKTGKYPVIRFSDIGGYAEGTPPLESEIKAAIDWSERGGMVGFMWYWNSPAEDSAIYAKDTKFNLENAVTEEEIAQLGISEIQTLCREGKINNEALALIEDIDKVSSGLLELAEEGIPVLWRPLHEAGGGWYWWGAYGEEAYKWLYNLMYERMTKYHGLDNLIWIWNGQSEDYLVDSDKYDIAAIDVYLESNIKYGSRSEQFQWLKKITENEKMLALSECSSVPGISEMLRDNSMWTFFGLWYGEYLSANDLSPDKIYTTDSDLIRMYNAENSITLDEYSGIYGHQE